MKYYVVSDVHSHFSLMKKALEEAGFFEETEPHKLVVCGDLLDRGTEAKEMIAFMTQLLEEDRLIYILGNHEDLLMQCVVDIAKGDGVMGHHYLNKTFDSLLQISEMEETEAYTNREELVKRVLESPFCQKLLPSALNYYETPNYIFTHGWIPSVVEGFRPFIKFAYRADWREADEVSWERARWLNGMELACKYHVIEPDKTIVCGHFHTSYGHALDRSCSEWDDDAKFTPFRAKGVWAIDACTVHSKMVNCIVIED